MIRRTHELAANWVQGWIPNFLFDSILIAIPRHFIAGFIAAWWQSLYGGFVPAGSLFAGLQRLGMVIGHLGPFAGMSLGEPLSYSQDQKLDTEALGMFGGWFFGWVGRLMPANPLLGTIWRFFMGGLFF